MIKYLALAICGLFAGHTVAMEKESDLWSSVIDGSADPAAVPYWLKVEGLFGLYFQAFRPELLPLLSPADSALLDRLVPAEEVHKEQDANAYIAGLASLCGNADGMDAVELARREAALEAATHESQTARYRAGLKQLSANGRKVVERFIDKAVTPNVRLARSEMVRFATEDEEEFRHSFNSICDAYLNGPTRDPVLDELSRDESQVLSIGLSADEHK